MGAPTVLPPSRLPRRTATLTDVFSRAPSLHINPDCMVNPAAAPKKPKRPSSIRGGDEPPAKRVRGVDEPHPAPSVSTGIKKRPCPSSDKEPRISVIKNQPVHLPIPLPVSSAPAQPKPSSSISMHELIEKARQAKARPAAEKAVEIERRRTEARKKVEQIVATVEFNDPFLDPADAFMSRQQLMQAREAAADAQARTIAVARRREMEAQGKQTTVLW